MIKCQMNPCKYNDRDGNCVLKDISLKREHRITKKGHYREWTNCETYEPRFSPTELMAQVITGIGM